MNGSTRSKKAAGNTAAPAQVAAAAPAPAKASVATAGPAPAPANAKKSAGRKAGSPGYRSAEVMGLLAIIKGIKPLGGNQWEEVAFMMRKKAEANEWPLREMDSWRL